jgi:hypothetical protein
MIVKTGIIVSHTGALEWGAGKVMEVSAAKATIDFSDGISRKIASTHFNILQPAAADSYSPPPMPETAVKVRAPRTVKKKKVLLPVEAG